jgi:RNA polymerase sigma factor (sigma-70 family)
MHVKLTVFESLQQGDIGPLYRQYYPLLLMYAEKKVCLQDAEEFVNDAFFAIHRLGADYFKEGERHVVSLLYVIVRNLCFDLFRKGKRRPRILPLTDLNFRMPEAEEVDKELLEMLVRQEIKLLPPRCGLVLELTLADRTTAEVAAIMHTSKRTVLNQRGKGVRILREVIAKFFPNKPNIFKSRNHVKK